MDPFAFISGFGGSVGYLVVLGALLLCGFGAPIPEDIILIAGGYIAFEAGHPVWPMVLTGLVGILAGDSLIFYFGRRFGLQMAQRTFLRRFLTPERLASVDGLFKKHGQKILLAARFTPGLRSVTFFSSGAMGVPYWKFLLFDGLAALLSAPLWVILGYRYGHPIVSRAKEWQGYILSGMIFAIVAYVGFSWLRNRRRAATVSTLPGPLAMPAPTDVPAAPRPAANER
jgi:membrane protein DedA with SNARE-associated domain